MNNQTGLFRKYNITKSDGSPVAEGFLGFVLRLDEGSEPKHRAACLAALAVYADRIEPTIPDLARDLRAKYALKPKPDFQAMAASNLAVLLGLALEKLNAPPDVIGAHQDGDTDAVLGFLEQHGKS